MAATCAAALAPALGWRRAPRRRRSLSAAASGGAARPERFDDLTSPPDALAVTSLDSLLREQLAAMQRAQAELQSVQQSMDASWAEATAAAAAQPPLQGRGGPCGYRWHRSVERAGPGARRGQGWGSRARWGEGPGGLSGRCRRRRRCHHRRSHRRCPLTNTHPCPAGGSYREYRSESFMVIGQPAHHCGAELAPPGLGLGGPLASLGLLLAAALAGFWASATAALHRNYGLTSYAESARWRLLAAWPLLLLTSPEFREQFWAAVRGPRGGGGAEPSPPGA